MDKYPEDDTPEAMLIGWKAGSYRLYQCGSLVLRSVTENIKG